MEFKDSVKLLGDFHHIEISPTATIELGTDVTLRSFMSLEVSDNAKLTLGNRVFLMIIVRFVVVKKLKSVKILCLEME